ncbi:hypothetical protein IU500_06785 [Nocardia terpenica]|uniref:hypothetical protein n=1 Tax=Nocardia terpenica TaxID=455432 RepID=UPI001893EBF5|nr:hypothetical protein [Nocardia terpenica]MBF6060481.1 hypothetical protein [Nocardia terpenica]MBF6103741.1 hypothetical protein [Nocardia terpenica]MBF6111885.1 hypothetical protein [Nocardia terpenica]MBF6117962.1 hypothetical protein [Nocardia terpenica]MBF6155312.1 hypothetical protein [Nocardia terpenica]
MKQTNDQSDVTDDTYTPHASRDHYERLHAAAVDALSTAVLTTEDDGTALDFGDFLGSVLTTVAANVGGVGRLVAARSGSWEATHIQSLAGGELADAEQLAPYRTAPVVVPLNIAAAIERMGRCESYRLTAEEAEGAVREWAIDAGVSVAEYRRRNGVPTVGSRWIPLIAKTYIDELDEIDVRYGEAVESGADLDRAQAEYDREADALNRKWERRYRLYADSFGSFVRWKAAQIGLDMKLVQLKVVTNPAALSGVPQNPSLCGGDDIVATLWETAFEKTPTSFLTVELDQEL